MGKQKKLFGITAILFFSILIFSGCLQQDSPSVTLTQTLTKAETIKSVYYELDISRTITGQPKQNSTIKIWEKTPYLKQEETYTIENITKNITVIKHPEGVYRYNSTLNTYQLVSNVLALQPPIADIAKDLLNNQTITILETQTIDGKTTTVIQYTPSEMGNQTTMKMWIWNDKGVPLKALLTTTKDVLIMTIEYRYRNYSFVEIPDSTFNIT